MIDIEAELRRLEAEALALRIAREQAEMQARQVRIAAEEQSRVQEQREREQKEQEERRREQEEHAERIRAWRADPFAYAEEIGLW